MTSSPRPERILILIPAFNEAATIRHVVRSVRAIVPHADVLVIDDGSTDATTDEANAAGALVVRHTFNLGIGGAVQTGLKFARRDGYDFILRLDGDGQHNPADIPPVLTALRESRADAVFGSRFLEDDRAMGIPVSRRLGIRFFALAVSVLTRRRATDTTSGFCGFNRRAIQTLARYMPQDYPEVESRVILHKAGLTTLELPVDMQVRRSGVSSIDNWRSIYYALKVSVAVLITALKDVTVPAQESLNADTGGAAGHSHRLQPSLIAGDGATDP